MKKIILVLSVILGVLALGFGIITKLAPFNSASSISIIGGADGPTSIFLVGKAGDGFSLFAIIFGIVLLVSLLIFILKRK